MKKSEDEAILIIKFAELFASKARKLKEPIIKSKVKLNIKRRVSTQLTKNIFYFAIQKKKVRHINCFPIFTIKAKILTNIVI